MKVEILFPEICNLCGDLMNVRYLCQSCPQLETVETDLKSRPRFLDEDVALVYMGTTTEKGLDLSARALEPYRQEMLAKIEAGQLILLTGNAVDCFTEYIDDGEGWHVKGLGIVPGHAQYRMLKRHNSLYLGRYGDLDVVGFKSIFGHIYDAPEGDALFQTRRGVGRNENTAEEGWHIRNLMATHLTGPLLPLNPLLTEKLLEKMGAEHTRPAFEETAMQAYRARVAEFAAE